MVAYCQHCRQRRCVGCLTGFLGCRCRGYEQSSGNTTLCDVFWLLFLFGTGVYIWFWFYYWILAKNSMDLINWYVFGYLGTWLPFYFVMLALTCAALVYILILSLLLLFHFIVDFQLYIHWVHRVILVVILLMSVAATIGLDFVWSPGWRLMHISLMITAPFLHIGGVVLATVVSWFVAGQFMRYRASHKKSTLVGVIWILVYIVVMLALYLSPLTIVSPCIVAKSDLPPKPFVLAHKGASAIAPENTMTAFEYAADNNVLAFESDVIISYDGEPFILHDSTFRRTTNIGDVFPKLTDVEACWLNMSQIKQLDAGSWFLRDDPYGTAWLLSDARRKLYANQTVPTLKEMLLLAMARNVSVMFDIKSLDYSLCKGHPYEYQYGQIVVDVIHQLKFPNDKMWWLYYKSVSSATSFRFVSANVRQSAASLYNDSATTVNLDFSAVMWNRVLYYLDHNIWVNIFTVDSKWLYSLYWCMNVSSVTTNMCHEFAQMSSPVWHMAPEVYLAVWIAVDSLSAVIVLLFWIIQRILHRRVEVDSDSYSLQPAPTATSTYRPETMHQQLINVENC